MYSNDQDLYWSNATLLTYKDMLYGSDGFLRLSISTSTPNFKDFNQPKLNLMISNNFSKSAHLDIIQVEDCVDALANALDSLKTNGGFKPTEVKRKIQKNLQIIFSMFVDDNKREPLVKIELSSNESDFTRTIMGLTPQFTSFVRAMRRYREGYINLCSNLLSQSFASQFTEVPQLIKGLPSGIISKIPAPDEQPPSEETVKGAAETAVTMDNFETFVDTNLDTMKVPEIEKASDKHVTEFDSKFVKGFIENDLTVFETIMNNESLTAAPITAFAMRLSDLFGMEYESLPGITGQEMKSLQYMSKLYFSLAHQNYVNNGVSLPHATPIFKYKAKEFTDDNLELAFDLLLFSLYIRGVRRRLEGKENDALKNCSLFHLQLRCFIDPFIFSFIDGISSDKLNTVIIERYKYYKDQKVFSVYERKLQDYNCPELSESDISTMIGELTQKVIGKTPYICELHDKSVPGNSLRLPSSNNFTLEQIINEIVPLEVAEKTGKDIKDESIVEQIKKSYPITDEILNFFKKGKKKVKVEKQSTITTSSGNLERVVNYYIDDIPEQYKESFVSHIKKIGNTKFNFITTFPLEEFGDDVIKALYVWDPESDPKITKNYKELLRRIETEIMEKDQILAAVKESVTSSDDGWGEIV